MKRLGRRRVLGTAGALAGGAGVLSTAASATAQAGFARVELPTSGDSLDVMSEAGGPFGPGGSELVTRLPQDTQVRPTSVIASSGADGINWASLRLWNAVDGWVPWQQLALTPAPPKPPVIGTPPPPWRPPVPPAQGPFTLHAHGGIRLAAD